MALSNEEKVAIVKVAALTCIGNRLWTLVNGVIVCFRQHGMALPLSFLPQQPV